MKMILKQLPAYISRRVRIEESVENVPELKKRRSNKDIEVIRNFIDTQQKRYEDECRRKKQMHKCKNSECMCTYGTLETVQFIYVYLVFMTSLNYVFLQEKVII